jgi:hypothetical protein
VFVAAGYIERVEALAETLQRKQFADDGTKKVILAVLERHRQWTVRLGIECQEMEWLFVELEKYLADCPDLEPQDVSAK